MSIKLLQGRHTAYATHWIISLFGQSLAQSKHYIYSQASRVDYLQYLYVLKYLLLFILKEKGVMQTSSLQTSNCDSFLKVSQLDVCKHIHLHHSFLLKYNNNNK